MKLSKWILGKFFKGGVTKRYGYHQRTGGVDMYTYKVIREDYYTGKQGNRSRTITRNRPLTIGGLYFHLGKGFNGCWRVLKLIEELKL